MKLPTLQTNQDLLSLGEYFTWSKLRPKQHRRSRWPRIANTDIDYSEHTPSSDTDKKPKPNRSKNTPPADGPTAARVRTQSTTTETPVV